MARQQQEGRFAEITPDRVEHVDGIAVTVRGAGAEVDIRSGADAVTMETVLRVLKSCWATLPERTRCILPVATPTWGAELTDWQPWFSRNSSWIRSPTHYFCFAADGGTGSKHCTGRAMDLRCCTNGWNPILSCGHEKEDEARILSDQQYRGFMERVTINWMDTPKIVSYSIHPAHKYWQFVPLSPW